MTCPTDVVQSYEMKWNVQYVFPNYYVSYHNFSRGKTWSRTDYEHLRLGGKSRFSINFVKIVVRHPESGILESHISLISTGTLWSTRTDPKRHQRWQIGNDNDENTPFDDLFIRTSSPCGDYGVRLVFARYIFPYRKVCLSTDGKKQRQKRLADILWKEAIGACVWFTNTVNRNRQWSSITNQR